MSTSKSKLLVSAAVALATSGFSATVYSADEATSQGILEEITVTARKREENLQDVGTSISALGTAEIERRSDVDLQSFANAAPNVVINDIQQGPGSPAAISIRGIGTTDVEKNFDPTAGVVVDGVFIGVNSGAMIKALDLQGMEILRGPQGTLFGRNSIAGVINVTRKKPSGDTLSGAVRAGGGNHGDLMLDGYVNIPFSDKFFFKIGAAKRDSDGWFYNQTRNEKSGKVEFTMISPSFTFRPTDTLEINYRFDRTEQDQDANTLLNVAQNNQVFCLAYGECAQGVQTPQSGDRYTVLQNGVGDYQTYFDSELHIANVRWDVNDSNAIEYVFGKFSTEEEVFQDWDGTSRTLYHTDRPATWDQTSHELRWVSSGDRLDFTAGLYVWESDYRIDLRSYIGFGDVLFGLPAGTVLTIDQTVIQNTESKAFFFEGDYRLTDALTLTLGGRYTEDDKDSGLIDVAMPDLATLGNPANPFKKSWNEFTPKVNLRYRVNEDVMVYGLYSKGFRAGGFSGRPGTYEAASIAYDPETVDNFELGWKTEWMDGRVRLNGSVFMMKYDDKQEEQSVPTSTGTGQQTLVLNAAQAEINGIELDIAARLTDNFTLSGNLGIMDSKFKTLIDTDPATPANLRDLSYLKLRRAPDYTVTISPNYTWNVGNGSMWVQADVRMVDDQELTFLNSPQSSVKAHEVIDASIGYRMNNTTFTLWGMNLTDDDSWTQAYDVGTSVTFPGLWTYAAARPPRTYGLRITHNFGN
ncbi:MAG: TonB-dependent receptor [Gammaproteobacteria bacterium]|nr:TonB-dependent receptor [Gammaproteobacteria bacterium]